MNQDLKAKWIEALRSGEYEQSRWGIGNVRTKTLCCLGVGAHVANPSRELDVTTDATDELERHGLVCSDEFGFSGPVRRLIEMNDNEGKTFPEIADYIEQNL